jgi:lipoprotein signal peptidase
MRLKIAAWCILAMACMIVLDQATKAIAMTTLPEFSGSDGVISLGTIINVEPPELMPIRIFMGLFVYAYVWSLRLPKSVLCMWTAGGLSNIMEFISNGGVVDFIGIRDWSGDEFTVYNVADGIIYMGFAVLIIYAVAGKVRATDFIVGSAFLRPEDWGYKNVESKESK